MKIKTDTELVQVAFHGDPLYLVTHDGEPYVPMRPVVEGMGLAWQSQHVKLTEDKERFSVTEIVTVAGDGKNREMLCMPLRRLFGWLMTISPNKVKPALRERIIRYQRECDDVLWRHWTRKAEATAGQGIGPYLNLARAHLGQSVASLNAAILLEWLAIHCADGRSYAFTVRELSSETQVSRTGVFRALNSLEAWGIVRWEKDHPGLTGRIRLLVGRLRQALDKPPRQAVIH